jgi:alanine racemase
MIYFSQLQSICNGEVIQLAYDRFIEDLITDSRKILPSENALFFAISGERHDGHKYINELYHKGIRQFIVEKAISISNYPDANILKVKSCIQALQSLAEFHRNKFSIPVIGITGSNGKTIIKEWLYQLLSPDYKVVKNPGSYNSQIGVPLSVWNIRAHHTIGIFEAGISKPGEMNLLERIIKPTIGIFTNIGTAHDEGFSSLQQKINEKLNFFTHTEKIIYRSDYTEIHNTIRSSTLSALGWGANDSDVPVRISSNQVLIDWQNRSMKFNLTFHDKASVENCIHCIVSMLYLGYPVNVIQSRIDGLKSIPMRLELKQGFNNCQLIDDSYNNDFGGLRIGLDFLGGIQKKKKTLILSDILQSGYSDIDCADKICDLIKRSDVKQFIGVGPLLSTNKKSFSKLSIHVQFYPDTQHALKEIIPSKFHDEVILIKGARPFEFEKIVTNLQRKVHGTRMEINLNKIIHNLNFFKSRLNPGVKIMVMVKALAYGSGSEEIATLLQYHRVDYLGVAYADEGIELRKNQITIPIMVMNATEESYQSILEYNLEPVMYSMKMLNSFSNFIGNNFSKVHLEIETGMNRLGIDYEDLPEAVEIFKSNPQLTIETVFSHLAGADEVTHDSYSTYQLEKYNHAYDYISKKLVIKPLKHILNSPGILRLPQFQMDMVRLGIGLYGINPTQEKFEKLSPAAALKTIISQIKTIKKGETIGYGRRGKADKDLKIATIAIGYADGFSRTFSRGVGYVLVNGTKAPVIGNVCMDMTMVDITGIDAKEGDDVIIFGDGLPIHEVAERANTIPYEILTNTSERVKRVFFAESL